MPLSGYGGRVSRDSSLSYNPKAPPPLPTTQFGNPNTFTSAANTQASDYDTIMKNYSDLVANNNANPISAGYINPLTSPYAKSADVTGSLSNLSNLATTGGYSDQDKADLRARGVAPIRSVYANAQQNIERQKAIQGGYSPNFTAATAKMSRDESQGIADATQNVNAGIAQNVASNRIAASPAYASASSAENAAQTESDRHNADIINQISSTNAGNDLTARLAGRQGTLGAIGGQANLYGTTPALTNTFGNQVVQAAGIGQNQQQINLEKQKAAFGLPGMRS